MKNPIFTSPDLESARKKLGSTIARLTGSKQTFEGAIAGLHVYKRTAVSELTSAMYEPCVCVIAQGAKRVVVGDEAYTYDAQHFLLTSVDIPTMVQIAKASPEKPCLGLVLKLDMREVAQMMVDGKLPPPREQRPGRGMTTGETTPQLIAALQRLLDLFDEPKDIPVLAPVIQREILYRLLVSDQGARLRQIAVNGSQGNQIAQAIDWLKGNFSKPLRVEDLAARAYMSPSTFHHHFRELTAMSPLQYQKWLRLNEARRLMLTEKHDAATAAMEVGYESPSQFSREYSRQFGQPPLRDITHLRQVPGSRVPVDQAA
jgi:AraC-like DNA-binding protein